MNSAVTIILFLSIWKWGDWRNWQKYQPTMLLAMAGNLLYRHLYCDQLLWQIQPDLTSSIVVETFYSVFIFPFTAFLFLSNYPSTLKKLFIHILKYIMVYTIFEFIFSILGKISYNHGWNLLWSLGWNVVMFSIWALHYKRPLLAYGVSAAIVTGMLLIFPVALE